MVSGRKTVILTEVPVMFFLLLLKSMSEFLLTTGKIEGRLVPFLAKFQYNSTIISDILFN